MQFVNQKVNFRAALAFDEHLEDPSKIEPDFTDTDELARYAAAVCKATGPTKGEEWLKWYKIQMLRYSQIIVETIKVDNINGVNALQNAISWYDRACSDFDATLLAAAEFGSLKMFLYALEKRRLCSAYYDDPPDLHLPTFIELAEKNKCPAVLSFLQTLPCCVDPETSNLPYGTSDCIRDAMEDFEDIPQYELARAEDFERLIKEAIDRLL